MAEAKLSPMMEQYVKTKEQYKDCILMYRVGDFFEMFFDDAILVSKELELVLTGKECGLEEKAPMAGIPFHAVDNYISKLLSKGYKVAVCDQVEDPKLAKGLVKREITKIVTPGTNTNVLDLDETKNNYIFCVFGFSSEFGIAVCDVSTGDFYAMKVNSVRNLINEIQKYTPKELVGNSALIMASIPEEELLQRFNLRLQIISDTYFDEENATTSLKSHFKGLDSIVKDRDNYHKVMASGGLLNYLYSIQVNQSLDHICHISFLENNDFMLIDSFSRRNLELTETLREKQKRGSLLGVLDSTKTAMGARLLRSFIEQPLMDIGKINDRLDAIEEINNDVCTRNEIREYLNTIYDLERILSKISYNSANPRDLVAFLKSVEYLPAIKEQVKHFNSAILTDCSQNLDTLEDLYELIFNAINEDPPMQLKEGGIIKSGYNEEVDRLREAKSKGGEWLRELEEKERANTGIKSLKIKYARNFGYNFEVTNTFKELVPERWIRRQTLVNAERYTSDELIKLEKEIMGAEDRLFSLEYDLFNDVKKAVNDRAQAIQETAKKIALIDVLTNFSYVSGKYNFVRPVLNENGVIDIKSGRHPVIEQLNKNEMFTANDTLLDNKDNLVNIITGPNMAGKSTYMRQTAVIVVMAQIGCFVPAKSANIGIVDRIFTRVGASDDLSSGQSTFMVEMNEVSNILRYATKNSLLILDEIGRGTSTYDGLSIAWAVVEYIANHKLLGAKTLFATHYHELTELEGKLQGVKNYCVLVREHGEEITFLRKIARGGADKSYGIFVAGLAGIPESVLLRAKEISSMLLESDISKNATDITVGINNKKNTVSKPEKKSEEIQLSFFKSKEEVVADRLRSADISRLTPIEALVLLNSLKDELEG